MIRKVGNQFVLFAKKIDPRTGKRRVLGRFPTREGAERHERRVQFFKRKGVDRSE